tara:strand:+ start:698 stop:1114 length:417 start_codon:yes stop_codon:yes gene_type:complete
MERWMIYGIIAAIFIAIRDIFSNDLINRYEYIDYIIWANIIIFIATLFYIYLYDIQLEVPERKDIFIILLRLAIVYMIIEPSIFYSIKYCDNPGYAKSIINLNTLFVFILAFFFLKAKIDKKKILGILLIFTGSYYIS